MITGLRGLAQAFVRGAVAIGRAVETTYTALSELGLGYVREQFDIDWQLYDQQRGFCDLAKELPTDRLIPGVLHGESPQLLTCKFKYDVKSVYENVKGETKTLHWSVISEERLTQDQIGETAQAFAEDYAPDGFPFHSEPELEGIWYRD